MTQRYFGNNYSVTRQIMVSDITSSITQTKERMPDTNRRSNHMLLTVEYE